jgi:hypothetical protein
MYLDLPPYVPSGICQRLSQFGEFVTDEEIELRPPTAQQVARRALNLSAVVCRGSIDKGSGDPHAEKLLGRIRDWLGDVHLVNEQEPWEAEIMRAGLGQLQDRQITRATWAVEGLAVLSWALGCYEFPSHDQKVDPFAITDSLGFLAEDADEFISTARVRSAEELHDARELMYAVHCRLRDFLRNKNSKDFKTWVEGKWLDVMKVNRVNLIVAGDLGVGGKAITEAALHDIQNCEWVVCEQHRASIWLVGEEFPSYWDWGVDT